MWIKWKQVSKTAFQLESVVLQKVILFHVWHNSLLFQALSKSDPASPDKIAQDFCCSSRCLQTKQAHSCLVDRLVLLLFFQCLSDTSLLIKTLHLRKVSQSLSEEINFEPRQRGVWIRFSSRKAWTRDARVSLGIHVGDQRVRLGRKGEWDLLREKSLCQPKEFDLC